MADILLDRKYDERYSLDMLVAIGNRLVERKLVWEEFCACVAVNFSFRDGDCADAYQTWTSRHVLKLLIPSRTYYGETKAYMKAIIKLLRLEDSTHMPALRLDNESGKILDWNRSILDLTGIGRSEVVGQKYEDVLRERVPSLSTSYRTEALKFVLSPPEEQTKSKWGRVQWASEQDEMREKYVFPLPLPLLHNPEGNDLYCDYVELLSKVSKHNPEFGYFVEPPGVKWHSSQHKEPGWFGGTTFTLRRKRRNGVPSLQSLCRAIVPHDHVNPDGSLAHHAANASSLAPENYHAEDEDALSIISSHISSSRPASLKYMREVLLHLRELKRKCTAAKKNLAFTEDWSKNDDTRQLNEMMIEALGGVSIVEQSVKSGKLYWKILLGSEGKDKKDGLSRTEIHIAEMRRRQWILSLDGVLSRLCPAVAEQSPVLCEGSDAPYVIPAIERPDHTVLTLKVEGVEGCNGTWEEEPMKCWVTVRVPATLNFFQLHRVVIQAVTGEAHCKRETHEWTARNLASKYHDAAYTDGVFDKIQVGETYFVEGGRRQDYGNDDSLFKDGNALRQRVSRTAGYFDQKPPLFTKDYVCTFSGQREHSVGKLCVCPHSTCISALFFQPGAEVFMQDGLAKFCAEYKISCSRINKYDGAPSKNPDINAFLPKCLRGKCPDGAFEWSVERANKQLHLDRGCLRRMLCKMNSQVCMHQLPWCYAEQDLSFVRELPTGSFATSLHGADGQPIYLWGEPPLPESRDYNSYVSGLEERYRNFSPRCVFGKWGSTFAVPFGSKKASCNNCSDDEGDLSNEGEGALWEREADEVDREMAKKPKAKKRGKKRKKVETSA